MTASQPRLSRDVAVCHAGALDAGFLLSWQLLLISSKKLDVV
jgi:hypothetical protein